LTLQSGASSRVSVHYKIPKKTLQESFRFQLVGRDEEQGAQTYALGELKLNYDPQKPVELPIPLNIYEHNQSYFAYEPTYPRENQMYFDVENRAWVVTPDSLNVLVDNEWKKVPVALGKRVNFPSSVIGFDQEGNIYTIVNIDQKPHLL